MKIINSTGYAMLACTISFLFMELVTTSNNTESVLLAGYVYIGTLLATLRT